MQTFHKITAYILASIILSQGFSCSLGNKSQTEEYRLPDTLRVGTLYSPTSIFFFRGDTLGYEYERISNFAKDKGIATKFVVARNIDAMIAMLDSGSIDVIAFEIPATTEYKERVLNCGTENITHQVLVQKKSDNPITDVTQLVGKEVYVEKNSKYESRLHNLDEEIGGGIIIRTISGDSLNTEDLISLVAEGKIQFTVIDSDIAQLNRTYYNNIDIDLPISFPQKASWAVRLGDTNLADSINVWSRQSSSKAEYKKVLKRYFELSKSNDYTGTQSEYLDPIKMPTHKKGKLSEFDALFKENAKNINWDWRLLAAQAWIESRFDTTAVSWAGARGIMQIMPGTARAYNLNPSESANAAKNIRAATDCLKDINSHLSRYVPDKKERLKFIVAAYNSGVGHVIDAIALARKYGKNPHIWSGNVEETILWKSNPDFYNDEVCHYGYFRGRQTVSYVKKVFHQYELLKKI